MVDHWSDYHVVDLLQGCDIISTLHEVAELSELKVIDVADPFLANHDVGNANILGYVDHLVSGEHQVPRFHIELLLLLHLGYSLFLRQDQVLVLERIVFP